ncbi:MAG: hypothetical protein UR72_C0004G0063 [Parcubacteria group bacterium GW2011_GWC1_35_21]|nr:MAG: hypothetical protein UR72_C0004G0063 [Parcubacteria group bacterium GW2011_GWC1_35_21]
MAQVYANPILKTSQESEINKIDVKKIPINSSVSEIGGEKVTNITKEEPTSVLGTEVVTDTKIVNSVTNPIESLQKPTFWQEAFASPRNTTNVILYIIFGIITIALLLYLFIKTKNYHSDLITNGLIVLAIVGMIFVANYYFSYRNMIITQSLDYSNEDKLYF